jgi:hypothetical protein
MCRTAHNGRTILYYTKGMNRRSAPESFIAHPFAVPRSSSTGPLTQHLPTSSIPPACTNTRVTSQIHSSQFPSPGAATDSSSTIEFSPQTPALTPLQAIPAPTAHRKITPKRHPQREIRDALTAAAESTLPYSPEFDRNRAVVYCMNTPSPLSSRSTTHCPAADRSRDPNRLIFARHDRWISINRQ